MAGKTKSRSGKGSKSDPVCSPHTKAELDTIRAQKADLRRLNAGVRENVDGCMEAGEVSEEHSKKNNEARGALLASVYGTYLCAQATGEIEELRRHVQARSKRKLGADPTIIRGLIRIARPALR